MTDIPSLTDPGIRQKWVDALTAATTTRKAQLGELREQLAGANLEDAAQASLSKADSTILAAAGLVNTTDATEITAQMDALQTQIRAIQRLVTEIGKVP